MRLRSGSQPEAQSVALLPARLAPPLPESYNGGTTLSKRTESSAMKKKTVNRQNHPAREVVIKRAAVDVLMVPLVNWLNSFEEVTTLFCCQGSPEESEEKLSKDPAYVLFLCHCPLRLMSVLKEIGHLANTEVIFDVQWPMLRYYMRFHSRRCLDMATKSLAAKGFS
jgi:hypothetical protein